MRFGATLLFRLIVRPLLREPLRTGLTVLAVALGVGVVVAIDLAGQAAAGSFHSSMESLIGKSDLEIRGTGGVPEQLLGKLVQLPYDFRFTPRIEDFASIGGRGASHPLIGLDLISTGAAFATTGAAPLGGGVFVSPGLHLKSGQMVQLLVNDKLQEVRVAGVLPRAASASEGGADVILADIGTAQALTGKGGRLDSIEVVMPRGGVAERWQQKLQGLLPASVRVESRGARTEENRKMLSAFRWNLHVLSYIALVVGGFLIYNTISISVVRRRAEIGIVRALGAARQDVLVAFLGEAICFALVGSVLGLLLGRVMAVGAVKLIGTTVQALYVSSQPGVIQLTPESALTGLALGLLISLLAGLAPSIEAAQVAPVEAMARGREQYQAAVRSRITVWLAAAMLALGVVFPLMPAIAGRPLFGYLAVLVSIGGTSLLMPNLVMLLARWFTQPLNRLFGVEALLAMQGLRASLARTSVLTSALCTAVAMTASVGIMVGSFRETVSLWMENQLKADYYLRPASYASADNYPTMSAEVADRIESLPGVAAVDRFRAYPITYEGMPATLAGAENSRVQSEASLRFLPGENRQQILAKLPKGNYAVVSEPFANKHHVRVGSRLPLTFPSGRIDFTVLGIYYDYSAERGYVVLDRQVLLRYLPDQAISNLAVYLKPSAPREQVGRQIENILNGRAILLLSHESLRRGAIAVFDKTFRITYALEAVAVFVAVVGIAGSLLATVIDRRREFGLVRSLGAERWQVRKIILCEAGILGLLANGTGLVLGTVLSLVLVYVINKQSFGWTIQFHWPAASLLLSLTGIYLATILAGLYPSRTATRLHPMEVLHES